MINALRPLRVRGGNVHGALERRRPREVRGVVVRVADDDGGEAAEGFDAADGGGVEQGEAVPEDVAVGGGLDEDCALADGEFGGGR